jgi:hypothetical protein
VLDLGASGYSPWIVEGAVRLGAARPFVPAAALLTHFTGTPMHPATLRRLTATAGTTMQHLALVGSEAAWADTAPAPAAGPLQVSVDGSMVPLRDGWHEVKLAAIGVRSGDGLTALSYTATLGDADTFGREALGELARRGVPTAPDVVAVNDGAEWIQGVLDLHCPQAGRVLDFAHAAGYLAQAAQATFGPGTVDTSAWFATQRHALRHGDPDAVLAALGALPPGEARDTAVRYLTARRDQIAYRDFTAQGWPIGSGCVESAHKGIVQARLKGPGMRWSRPVAEGLLALRIAEANARWDVTWGQLGARQRAELRTRTTRRRAARRSPPARPSPAPSPPRADRDQSHPPPPRPPRVRDGIPTADHPWRRFHLPGSLRFDHKM